MVEIPTFIFYGIVAEAALIGVVLGFVVYSHYTLLKKYYNLKEEEKRLKIDAEAQANKLIADAHQRAMAIIAGAETFSTQANNELRSQIQQTISNQSQSYQQVLNEVRDQGMFTVNKVSEDVKTTSAQTLAEVKEGTLSSLTKLRQGLEQEIISEQTTIRARIDKEFEEVKKQLEGYKAQMAERVDESISELVREVVKDVVGKVISTQDHEELIVNALEQAKRDHIL